MFEASELLKSHRCKDPICDTHLWKVKHELDMAKLKMRSLEAELIAKGITPVSQNSSAASEEDETEDPDIEEVGEEPK